MRAVVWYPEITTAGNVHPSVRSQASQIGIPARKHGFGCSQPILASLWALLMVITVLDRLLEEFQVICLAFDWSLLKMVH